LPSKGEHKGKIISLVFVTIYKSQPPTYPASLPDLATPTGLSWLPQDLNEDISLPIETWEIWHALALQPAGNAAAQNKPSTMKHLVRSVKIVTKTSRCI